MRLEYRFDYRKARPNRFAGRVYNDGAMKGMEMPAELKSECSIVSMRLTRKGVPLAEAKRLLAFAVTSVWGEVRAKYLRDQGVSTVRADVHVDAAGADSLELHAVVHVEATYEGDMVRSSPKTREQIDHRLEDLAQRHCAESVLKALTRDMTL
jgi:hypothetical protein